MESKLHFGDPMIEQRALNQGKAICLLPDRGIITVAGIDRLNWLHSLLSQDLKNIQPGHSAEALLLDPQGRIEQQIRFLDDGEASWLIVEADKKPALLDWLNKMVFRMKVQITDRSNDFAIVGSSLLHPSMAEVSNGTELVWQDPWPNQVGGGYRYSTRAVEYSWFEHLVGISSLESKLAGKTLAGTMAAEGLRVAAGRPNSNEIDDKTLPHELDLLSTAVHLSKGCYRGQESVAKVHNLGHPPRRLTFLHLDGSDSELPEPGDQITVTGDDKPRGFITSTAQHFEMGPIGLAMLQRAVSEDAPLSVAGKHGPIAANQEIIVPSSAGAVADVPKLPRINLASRTKPSKA